VRGFGQMSHEVVAKLSDDHALAGFRGVRG
jgi:hypothetical protein